jgi:hypothetical protein
MKRDRGTIHTENAEKWIWGQKKSWKMWIPQAQTPWIPKLISKNASAYINDSISFFSHPWGKGTPPFKTVPSSLLTVHSPQVMPLLVTLSLSTGCSVSHSFLDTHTHTHNPILRQVLLYNQAGLKLELPKCCDWQVCTTMPSFLDPFAHCLSQRHHHPVFPWRLAA